MFDGPGGPAGGAPNRWRLVLLFAWFAVVLSVTLSPTATVTGVRWTACIICGETGTADALRNLALFVPLGALVAWRRRPTARAVLFALALSFGIELAQLGVPGRYPSVGDLVFDTAGAGLGLVLPAGFAAIGREAARRRTRLMSLTLGASLVALVATSILAIRAPGSGAYEATIRPTLDGSDGFEGQVDWVRVGGVALSSGRIEPGSTEWRAVHAGESFDIRLVLDREPGRFEAGFFKIEDEAHHELLLLGGRGGDLLVRERRVADILRLDRPEVRLSGALARTASIPLVAHVERVGGGEYCANVLPTSPQRVCALGLTIASGWRYVVPLNGMVAAISGLVSMLWLGGLGLAVGWSAPRATWATAGGSSLLLAFLVIPSIAPVMHGTMLEGGALVGGLILGGTFGAIGRRHAAGDRPARSSAP